MHLITHLTVVGQDASARESFGLAANSVPTGLLWHALNADLHGGATPSEHRAVNSVLEALYPDLRYNAAQTARMFNQLVRDPVQKQVPGLAAAKSAPAAVARFGDKITLSPEVAAERHQRFDL